MGGNGNCRIDLGTIGTWLVIGVVAVFAFKIGLLLFGIVSRVALFALFTIGPILLVGWLVLKALRYFTRDTAPSTF
jgi:hypothetical protein